MTTATYRLLAQLAANAKRGTWLGTLEQAANLARDTGRSVIVKNREGVARYRVYPDGSVHRAESGESAA